MSCSSVTSVLLFVRRHSFTEDHYVEFSKHSQDRVIGTKGDIAHVSTESTAFKLICRFVLTEVFWTECDDLHPMATSNDSAIFFPVRI